MMRGNFDLFSMQCVHQVTRRPVRLVLRWVTVFYVVSAGQNISSGGRGEMAVLCVREGNRRSAVTQVLLSANSMVEWREDER